MHQAYAFDHAIRSLRENGVSPARWLPFVHVGGQGDYYAMIQDSRSLQCSGGGGERRKKGHTNNCTYINHELVFDISMVYVQEDKSGHCVRGSFHIPSKQVQDPGRGRRGKKWTGLPQRTPRHSVGGTDQGHNCDKRARAVRYAWRFDHAWGASLYICCNITDRSRK